MKTTIHHLPEEKQQEINLLVHNLRKHKEVHMIILFGSYATGKWVEDRYEERGVTYEYQSDYDLLVIVPKEDFRIGSLIEKDLAERKIYPGRVKTAPGFIFHGLGHVNNRLQYGSYFFKEVVEQGILLYDNGKYKLAEPLDLTPEQRRQIAQEHFNQWFESATHFFVGFETYFDKNWLNEAAFELHQSTERFFTTTLLVFTDYRPKQHDLLKLLKQILELDPRFETVFLSDTQDQKDRFELLRRAYIDARYRMDDYAITREDLEYLAERVQVLKELTEVVCGERIAGMTDSKIGTSC